VAAQRMREGSRDGRGHRAAVRPRNGTREGVRGMLEGAPFPAWMCDHEGQMTYLNGAFRSAVGGDGDSPPSTVWRSVVDPRDLEHWSRTFQSASVVLNPFKVEVQAGGADGRCRWYLLRGIPCSCEPDAGTYWGTAVDITAGKWRENTARETEDRYKALADLQDRATVGLDTELCVEWTGGRAHRDPGDNSHREDPVRAPPSVRRRRGGRGVPEGLAHSRRRDGDSPGFWWRGRIGDPPVSERRVAHRT
jgi:PAS domain-containing protein